MRTTSQRGFTLIEVLLAIAITATVMVTVATTFHVMLNARDVVDDMTESTEAGPRILNLIERDLRAIWTFNVKNNAVFRGRDMDVGGRDADRMDFLCTTDAAGFVVDSRGIPRKPTLCEVGYWFKPNQRYRDVFEMWRREDPMVDNDLLTQGSFQLVHDRIKSFKITYYETIGRDAEELHDWDSSERDQLPARIKIEFTIERKRSNRNIVSDVEIEDFEGGERVYRREFTFDDLGMPDVMLAGTARVPVFPIAPDASPQGGGGGAGGGAGGDVISKGASTLMTAGAGATNGKGGERGSKGSAARGSKTPANGGSQSTPTRSSGGGQAPTGLPPGFDLTDLLRGASGGGGFFGGGR